MGYLPSGAELEAAAEEVLGDLILRAAARNRLEERRRARLEETLRLSKFYSDVLTSVGQGIVVIDHSGKIRYRNPASARFLAPMAMAIVFGMVSATLMTLILVPVGYVVLEDLKALASRLRSRLTPRSESESAARS